MRGEQLEAHLELLRDAATTSARPCGHATREEARGFDGCDLRPRRSA